MHAQGQNREFRIASAEGFDQLQTRISIERNVDDGQGMVAHRHGRQRLPGVGRLAAKMKVVLKVEKLGHTLPHDGMVINHQDAGFSVPAYLVFVAAHAVFPFGPDK